MTNKRQTTPLHDWHTHHKGRMVDFAGWSMPVQYTSIIEEHHAVRQTAGLFDISHMGRLRFSGPQQVEFLQDISTNNVTALQQGQIQYSLITNEQGGILDDVLIYRFETFHLMVCNASNRHKLLNWIKDRLGKLDCLCEDLTMSWCMIAIQGPHAVSLLQSLTTMDLSSVGYYRSCQGDVLGNASIVSRTGYTGEDGFEVITDSTHAELLWNTLYQKGRSERILPAGLGARDTLRLEAGMPLYGHELSETIDPIQAGLSFAVKLDTDSFIGCESIRSIQQEGPKLVRTGLELQGRRIAREGSSVSQNGIPVGKVTSGTFSPTLEKSIAMGYVPHAMASPGQSVQIDIRGRIEEAQTVRIPFYKKAK